MASRRSYGSKQISQKRATLALSSLLYGCTPERLAGFTAAGLVAAYNVKIETAERKLADARARRAL